MPVCVSRFFKAATLPAVACCIPVTAGAAAADAARADADADGAQPAVVVTATRLPTPLDEVIVPVVLIERADVERSVANDASELLRFHAGFDLSRTGGPGQPTGLFLRGADSNHTLVLVDGVRINPGTIGFAPLQNLSTDMIERIEVIKGPRSSLWGSDAIGGVVNVVTRRGSREGWSTEIGYGAYDTRKASLSGGTDVGRHSTLDVGLAWLDSEGFPTRTTDDTDRGFENFTGSLQWRSQLGPAELALRHWRAEGTSEYSDFFLTPVDQDFENAATSAELRWPVDALDGGQARVALSHLDDRIDQNQSADFLSTDRDTVEAQFDWQAAEHHTPGVGASYSSEDAASVSFGQGFDERTDWWSAYVQDRIAAGPHQALLALGYVDHETAGSEVTWNAEYGYAVDERTRVFALAARGFRAPDATDRYGFGGNPDLEPERSLHYEAGLRRTLGDAASLELSAFQSDVDDLIDFTVISYEPFDGENRNVAQSRTRGVEAAWTYAREAWYARVEAIYQDPRDLDDDSRLLRRARESLTVSLSRQVGPVLLGLDVLATGDRKDFGVPEDVTLDGYVLANLTAQWQLTRSLRIAARLENALDEQYELADTFNTPGRGLYVTVRYAPPARAGRGAVVASTR
jgi:vitamin B12 transporter